MERKLCGVDLNGVQDYATRNWIKDSSGDDKFEEHTNVGPSRSSVVSLNTHLPTRYLGGVQAELAPHGRGEGYGEAIGKPEYRTLLRDIIRSSAPDVEKLKAAVLDTTPASDFAIFSIADSDSTTEEYQEALTMALRQSKFKHPLLVWRSVLASLSLVKNDYARVPCSIGIISHSDNGFDLQRLNLKSYNHQGFNVLVPERKKNGVTIDHDAGYDSLFSKALEKLKEVNSDRFLDVTQSKNIAALGLGRNVETELLRSKNGLWKEFTPPTRINASSLDFNDDNAQSLAQLNSCDFVIFETLTEGHLKNRLHASLENFMGRDIELLCDDAIAKAALFAAIRYANNIPIYFDYLPQISTIVQAGMEPTNFDLIDQSEMLKAGTVYRSKRPAILATQSGQTEIEIHLNREGDELPRRAKIQLPVAATSTHSVSVHVEQTPAQGRASIQINANDLGLSQTIDFRDADVLDTTWEDLLREIKVGTVPIPERMVLPASVENWEDDIDDGLTSLIDREAPKDNPNWKTLEAKIGRAVSSDGDLPISISLETDEKLAVLTDKAFVNFQARFDGAIRANNLSLRFMTWQFKRCPQDVCVRLIDMWEHYGEENFKHPLILNFRSWVLLFQGVGRAVFDLELEKRALFELLRRPVKDWHWEAHTACASFLVSRSKTAVTLLDSEMVDDLLERVKIEFSNNLETTYREFRYAPFLFAGLLRYREIKPDFLVLGRDPRAEIFIKMVERTLKDINNSREIKHYDRSKYNYWLSEIIKYIKCEGGNPKLLMDISNNQKA